MELNDEQKQAMAAIETFLDSKTPIFILQGYAGTGKTSLVPEIINAVRQRRKSITLMAPTGRAAKVLHDKTAEDAGTIHRCIYELGRIEVLEHQQNDNSPENIKNVVYYFPLRANTNFASMVYIIDEASMVGCHEQHGETFRFGSGCLLPDLLKYTRPDDGGKLIFIGDPAQLPPVGEIASPALDEAYFAQHGLKTMSATLTTIVRQQANGTILKNATQVRDVLSMPANERNRLCFDCDGTQVIEIKASEIPDKYISLSEVPTIGKGIVLTYTNRNAHDYNLAIRQRLHPDTPHIIPGDILVVCTNHYAYDTTDTDMLNGDFLQVLEVSPTPIQRKVNIKRKVNDEVKQFPVTLCFREIRVQTTSGQQCTTLIIESLLNSHHPNLNLDETIALFIDFAMRHPQLKRNSPEFKIELRKDPYYNALRVKYGYAITGHKSQGGEWDTVVVDYTGRTGLSDDCLRWTYTATTRARHRLFATSMPKLTPTSGLKITTSITQTSKTQENYRSFVNVPDTPFHDTNTPDFLKAKYWSIVTNLDGTPWKVANVISKPWREIYTIDTPQGPMRVDITYKKGGVFQSPSSTDAVEAGLVERLADETTMQCVLNYTPANNGLQELYNKVASACSDCDIDITNVQEDIAHYKVNYFLKTSANYAGFVFYVNKSGQITNGQPFSSLGADDTKLAELINKLI